MGLAALLAGLGGCKGTGPVGAGVDLFHDLQGGAIAQQRPPPPGRNDPFPNLGSIPARPAAPDIVAQQRLGDQLAAQRDAAEQAAAANPLTPRAPPPALPKPAGPPDPNANRVVVDAAPAGPAPKAVAPPPAAVAPAAAVVKPGSDVPALASVPAVAAAVVSGPLPSLAAAPPAAPVGFGVMPSTVASLRSAATNATAAAPAASLAAATPPKPLLDTLLSQTVVPRAPGDTIYKPPVVPVASSVAVAFSAGSAVLPPSAPLDLRRFALAHRGVPVTVTGHGDDILPGPDPQSRALDLALRRAQAIAAALATSGIPAVNLRLHAEAAGRGGSVSL